MVITAVVMVTAAVAMEATPMAMKLHVPLEFGAALVTSVEAGGNVASFDVCH